ncbi:hypothetical protein L596_009261 [Steinernema carpocapsae]|uniref:receptor protein-tyrosine kinase n=1 Tax=Steinernema carpocapsae TaxID=34508 RepID=A0A4U5PF06_STECR|nr:hypothetical protein L596_009261 [Steinernema carpocapsae]
MKVSVIAKASDSITLQFPNFNSFNKDERSFIGHQIFYKPVRRAYRNMPYLEEEDSCDSSWKMAFVTPDLTKGPERSELLVNLKPDTMYAFYVKTRMTDLKDHSISKILYIKTRYAIPDPPASLRASSPDPYSIDLTWKAPINPNGKITFYKVSWTIVKPSEAQEGMNHCQSSELAPKSKYNFKVGYDDQDLLDNNATCPAIAGCCNCADLGKKKLNIIPVDWVREAEAVKMENQIQNLIWTKRRKKRAIVPTFLGGRINEDGKATEGEYRVSSISTMGLIIVNETKSILKKLKIKDLYHFTNYRIQIYACQDPKEEGAKCSTESADAMVWTAPKPEFDVINASTVVHLDKEEKNTSRIFWELPATPNGEVLAFRLKFILTDKAPIEYCVTLDDFLANEGALVKNFTLKGDVKLEIRTETTYGRSEPSEVTKLHFKEEGWNLWIWIPLGVCGVVLVVVASIVIQRRYYKKKKEKYPEFYPYETYIADDWELPMDDFEAEKKIGGGSFGDVYKFTMKTKMISHSGYEFTVCAGKVLKSTEKQDRDKFLTEGSMMKKFDSPFVVKLYGIVSMCNPPMVVMEYMDRGNLRDYLRQNRPKGEGLIHMKKPTRKNMLWAAQIADGMAYLHSLNFCHRDLAARNILVSETDTVKIGDFGLSRELGLHDYYRPDSARQLPIRWMAPEALQDGTSTIQSDVWSYAIVLYEILTYGSIPYVGFANEEVKRRVVHKRLAIELPGEVPKDWDALIKACAQYEPSMRPTFKQVVKYVRHKIRDVRFDQVSFTINNDYQDVKPFSFKDFEEQQQPELLPAAMNMTNIFERSQDEIVRKANSLENVENNYFECETDVLLKDLATRAKSF